MGYTGSVSDPGIAAFQVFLLEIGVFQCCSAAREMSSSGVGNGKGQRLGREERTNISRRMDDTAVKRPFGGSAFNAFPDFSSPQREFTTVW